MRRLSVVAGVSVATMRHYFQSPEQVVVASLRELGKMGASHLHRNRSMQITDLKESLRWFLQEFCTGWQHGLGTFISVSLGVGIQAESAGIAFIEHMLEPALQALEARIAWHAEQGDIKPSTDHRLAALALFSPIFVALLHQGPLHGNRCRPLDIQQLVESQIRIFVEAYGHTADGTQTPP